MFQQLSHVILYLPSKPPNAVKCNLAESANCIFRGVTVRVALVLTVPSNLHGYDMFRLIAGQLHRR